MRRDILWCAHVVQSVSEFDQNDANIPCHGQRHFLKIFRLSELDRVELHMGKLADAINQFCNFLAKLRANVFLVDASIFDDVV